jgi:hypothetical protein
VYERATREDLYGSFDRRLAKPLGMEDWKPADGFRVYEPTKPRHPAHTFRISTRDLARLDNSICRQGCGAVGHGHEGLSRDDNESTRPHDVPREGGSRWPHDRTAMTSALVSRPLSCDRILTFPEMRICEGSRRQAERASNRSPLNCTGWPVAAWRWQSVHCNCARRPLSGNFAVPWPKRDGGFHDCSVWHRAVMT